MAPARLLKRAVQEFTKLNVLANNASIQHRVSLVDGITNWEQHEQELAINLAAPIHLSMLFIPHLMKQAQPAIVNVTSGLAFMVAPPVAVYSATKAGLHSFTMSLRAQVSESGIEVVEIVPPAVQTDLGGPGLQTFGEPLDEFTDGVMARVAAGEQEVGYGTSERARLASRAELDEMLANFSRRSSP